MQSIFLSKNLEELDVQLVLAVTTLLESHDLLILTGDALGGSEVSNEVGRRIGAADGCIALATPRDRLESGKYRTHPWVRSEVVMARTLKKRCVEIVHKDVEHVGAFTENEYVAYDPDRPLRALAKLMSIVGQWRRDAGRQMKVLVLPAKLAESIAKSIDEATCEYRYYDERGNVGAWQKATIVPAQGGPLIYLDGARDDSLLELRVGLRGRSWTSPATAAYASVQLRAKATR